MEVLREVNEGCYRRSIPNLVLVGLGLPRGLANSSTISAPFSNFAFPAASFVDGFI